MNTFPIPSCAILRVRRLAISTALLSAATLVGCSGSLTPTASTPAAITVTGNWQLSSTATAASRLPALSGELTGTSASISGILHADSASACISPTSAIAVTGSANAQHILTLSGSNLAGGTLAVTGTLAADGKSLSNATYNVTGGSCAFTTAATATAQAYSSITGTYVGSFSDPDGNVINISANLTQTPASDTTGNFQLSGTGTFPQNPCFSSPVSIASSQVTGGSFNLTYADPNTLNSVNASGTFSTDGTTLTVTNWTLTGSCGPDAGTGLLTKQ